jgi:hypothetical protein
MTADRVVIELVFADAVFFPADEAAYDQLIKIRAAPAAQRTSPLTILSDDVFLIAPETPDDKGFLLHSDRRMYDKTSCMCSRSVMDSAKPFKATW